MKGYPLTLILTVGKTRHHQRIIVKTLRLSGMSKWTSVEKINYLKIAAIIKTKNKTKNNVVVTTYFVCVFMFV